LPDNIDFDEAPHHHAGTSLYGIDKSGGFIVGEPSRSLDRVNRADGRPMRQGSGRRKVILTGTRDDRLELGRKLGADAVVNVKRQEPWLEFGN
jgi:L-iditol 2-dehydrogenase